MTCKEASQWIVDRIAEGLTSDVLSIIRAVSVDVDPARRNSEGWPETMVAVAIVSADHPEGVPAVFATMADGAPIFAVNASARQLTDWTADIKFNSQSGQAKNMFVEYPEMEEAVVCLGRSTGQ